MAEVGAFSGADGCTSTKALPLDNEDSNNAAQGSVVAADEEPVVAEAS